MHGQQKRWLITVRNLLATLRQPWLRPEEEAAVTAAGYAAGREFPVFVPSGAPLLPLLLFFTLWVEWDPQGSLWGANLGGEVCDSREHRRDRLGGGDLDTGLGLGWVGPVLCVGLAGGVPAPGVGLAGGVPIPGVGLAGGVRVPGIRLAAGVPAPSVRLAGGVPIPGVGLAGGVRFPSVRLACTAVFLCCRLTDEVNEKKAGSLSTSPSG